MCAFLPNKNRGSAIGAYCCCCCTSIRTFLWVSATPEICPRCAFSLRLLPPKKVKFLAPHTTPQRKGGAAAGGCNLPPHYHPLYQQHLSLDSAAAAPPFRKKNRTKMHFPARFPHWIQRPLAYSIVADRPVIGRCTFPAEKHANFVPKTAVIYLRESFPFSHKRASAHDGDNDEKQRRRRRRRPLPTHTHPRQTSEQTVWSVWGLSFYTLVKPFSFLGSFRCAEGGINMRWFQWMFKTRYSIKRFNYSNRKL